MNYLDNLSQITKNENISIYGAGSFGKTFIDQIERNRTDINIINLIDKYKSGYINQIKIIKLTNISSATLNHKIIICTSVEFWEDILNELSDFNIFFNRYHDFNVYYRDQKINFNNDNFINLFSKDNRKLKIILDCINNESIQNLLDNNDLIENYGSFFNQINLKNNDFIINGGSEFGDEDKTFRKMIGTNGRIYSFDANIATPKQNNNHYSYPYLLYKNECKIGFIFDKSRSRISHLSPNLLDAISIDTFMIKYKIKKIDFIKLDVEGSELEVLKGAKETIIKYQPNLAISVYHSTADFFEIPLYLKNLVDEYNFDLGIYNNQGFDTYLHATTATKG